MKYLKLNKLSDGIFRRLGDVKITRKLISLLVILIIGFAVIGFAYYQVLEAEQESIVASEKMAEFGNGIHDVQVDLLNARRSESEFYLKKYPIFLGKFDTRIIVASQHLKSLTSLVKNEKGLGIITELGNAFEAYRNSFIKTAEAQIEIGLDENTGMNVEKRKAIDNIMANIEKLNSTELERSMLRIRQNESLFMQKEKEGYYREALKEINNFGVILNNKKFNKDIRVETEGLMSEYKNIFIRIGETVGRLKKMRSDVKLSVKKIEPLFEDLLERSNQIITETRLGAEEKRNSITAFFIATLFVTGVLMSFVLLFLGRTIIIPMSKLQDTVIKVNEGDITARARLNRKDELGELAKAFDKLLDERVASMAESEKESEKLNESVIRMIRSVSKLAQDKNLSIKIPVSEDITGAIGDSLNLLAKETAKTLNEVKATSDQVASVSNIVKHQSDHVIEVANKERKEVEMTTNMLKDSVLAMNDIAVDAQSANAQADKTIENTQRALNAVLSSVEGINSIRSTISETEKRIKRLGERSQEISGIVNLINSIAERTHILALNASMHAASAGEAGRGFAVVADEVQRLAENAREATSEISTVVNNIRVETADTVTTMNDVITQVAEGTRLAEQAGQSMKENQQATNKLVNSVQQIANSSVKQADISRQLLERAKQIQQSNEETGRELYEQTKSTDTLVEYSQNLVSTVGVFILPDSGDKVVKSASTDKDSFSDTAEIRVAG
jgi:twitching motility protein PilJ